ncbi:hypothetical protein B9Z55_011361 [Caenorhabditis nigoni]|uniref:Serpentine Receptor, class H n=1 Tax=Caenorhabditis nigoni TaxID=1611254 RepID=A0A2G5UJR3_9PELO|nr:hypothetical protein B9Z55_011361 [Caenorhabditis nigoni]
MLTCIFEDSFLESSRFLAYALHTLTSIEMPLHIFGAYLIITKTPRNMKTAKYSILQLHLACTVMDLTITSLWIFYSWIPSSSGYAVGLMSNIGVNPLFQSFLAFNTMSAVAVSYVCLFENRYDAVVIGSIGRSENRNIYRVIYFIINIVILETILGYIFWKVPELNQTRMAERLPCLPKEFFENPNLININSGDTIIPYLALSIMCILFFQGAYFLVYTIYHLFKDTVYVSKSTRKMQQKFFISLFLQATIPSFALAAPMYCYYILYRMDYFYQVYNNFLMIAIGCNGLLTTLVMILVHRPYRMSVLEMCGIGTKAEQLSIQAVTLWKMKALGRVSGE